MERPIDSGLLALMLLAAACGGPLTSAPDTGLAKAEAGIGPDGSVNADSYDPAVDAEVASGVDSLSVADVVDAGALPAVLNLATDADRDGKVSFTDPDDEELEEEWSLKGGAVFLLNLDDDDGDGLADALDDVVNGPQDALDLTPVYLAPAPWLPATASLELTAVNGEAGRLFRRVGDDWVMLSLPLEMLAAELADDPIILGFEGREPALLLSPVEAERVVRLTLTARGAAGELLAEDSALLHHAPLLLSSPLWPVKEAWALSGAAPEPMLTSLAELLAASGVPLSLLDDAGEGPGDLPERSLIALAVRPDAQGHKVIYYPLLTAPSAAGLDWMKERLIGADVAPLPAPGGVSDIPAVPDVGNIESSPALLAGEMFLPYGKLYYGWNPESQEGPPEELLALLSRQGLQGEPMAVDTSFLHTGHLSEVLSWVPYSGDPGCCGKGFRMLFADPSLALSLADEWVAAGQGEATVDMLAGEVSLAELVADAEVRAFNEATAVQLADLYNAFLPEFGLVEEDVIRVPVLFFPHPLSGRAIPLLPAVTDAFVVGKYYLVSAPDDGGSTFELLAAWLNEALAPINAVVTFVPLPHLMSSLVQGEDFLGLQRLLVGRRKPDNVEWWLWFM